MRKEKQYLYLVTSLRTDTKVVSNNGQSYRFEKDIIKLPKKISKISDIIRFEKNFVKESGCMCVISLFFIGVNKRNKGEVVQNEEDIKQ